MVNRGAGRALALARLARWVAEHSPGEDARVVGGRVAWSDREHDGEGYNHACTRLAATLAEARAHLGY